MNPVLKVADLKKAYGAIQAVGGVSFEVRPGEIFGVIGPNGSGKTTMFNSVLGQITPDQGVIELNGRSIAGVNPSLVGGLSSLLKELNQTRKSSFVVIEHNMDFVMDLCHRIMVMVEGKVMAIGTPAEIRANKEVLDAYLGS